jgi:hypothetical protein
MSITTISKIENSIVELIKEATNEKSIIDIHLGTHQSFLLDFDNELPCILVSYTGCEPYENLYPGSLTFSITFIAGCRDREIIYDLMQKVFEKMNGCTLPDLNGGFKLQGDRFLYEDTEYLIFMQNWVCFEISIIE